MRVLALDYGSARCGCAVSDPTGTLATPIEPVLQPGTRKGLARVADLVRERGVERVVVGLPLSLSGADIVAEVVSVPNPKELMDVADRVKGRLGEESATVLGTVVDGRVHLVAAVTPALVARGVRAGAVVKAAALIAGGGGGGRDPMAQAGGRDPDKLPEAIAAARAAIEAALAE